MTLEKIFGREAETKVLDNLWKYSEGEFLYIYGRRRIGKTYLINKSQQSYSRVNTIFSH